MRDKNDKIRMYNFDKIKMYKNIKIDQLTDLVNTTTLLNSHV